MSNFTTITVTSNPVCGELFATPAEIQKFYAQETISAGWLYLGKFTTFLPAIGTQPPSTTVTNAANAQFITYKPFDYTTFGGIDQPSFGNCVVSVFSLRNPFTAPIAKTLDAGNISLTLPDGVTRNLVRTANSHVLSGSGTAASPNFIPDTRGDIYIQRYRGRRRRSNYLLDHSSTSSQLDQSHKHPEHPPQSASRNYMVRRRSRFLRRSQRPIDRPHHGVYCLLLHRTRQRRPSHRAPRSPRFHARQPGHSRVPSPVRPPDAQQLYPPGQRTASGMDNGNIVYYTGDTALVNFQ